LQADKNQEQSEVTLNIFVMDVAASEATTISEKVKSYILMLKFVELIKCENGRTNNNLAVYVNKAFKLRNLFNIDYDYP
jgi:hypothetical protein